MKRPRRQDMRLTRAIGTLFVLITLGACDGGGSNNATATAEEVPTRAFLEQAGPVVFSEQPVQIPNTSGKGGEFIDGRSYIPDDPGVYPLLVFLPGFGATFENYTEYSRHFASHGVVVVAITFANDDWFSFDGEHDLLLVQVADTLGFALDTIAEKTDRNRIAVMGHSLGGKMAFYAASAFNGGDPTAPRIGLAMGLDPVNSGGPPCFIAPEDCIRYPVAPNPMIGETGILDAINSPSLILRSLPDPLTNPDAQFNAELFYRGYDGAGLHAVPSPALYLDMGEASHVSYAQISSDENQVPVIARHTALAWLKTHLEDADNLGTFWSVDFLQEEIDAGLILSVEKR